ncbi:MAG: hotdog fold thioesterase [Bacteriovoracales bacterium]
MAIWFNRPSLEDMQKRGENTMVPFLGIEITEVGDDYLKATMPVDHRTKQPLGLLHGGANCVLAESVGSIAANYCIDSSKYFAVGLDINANHLRSVRDGLVTAIAKPLHMGKTTQVWEIKIENEEGKLACISRLTMAVVERKPK